MIKCQDIAKRLVPSPQTASRLSGARGQDSCKSRPERKLPVLRPENTLHSRKSVLVYVMRHTFTKLHGPGVDVRKKE